MLEDASMGEFLRSFLPRILPSHVAFQLITHDGKNDLDASLPRKLRAWREPNARFVVLRDQDAADCVKLKDRLVEVCRAAGRPYTLVRIACRELEAWFVADLAAVDRAFGTTLANAQQKRAFRSPDEIPKPSEELKRLVPGFGKVSGARALGPELDVTNRASASFFHFVQGILRITETTGGADG